MKTVEMTAEEVMVVRVRVRVGIACFFFQWCCFHFTVETNIILFNTSLYYSLILTSNQITFNILFKIILRRKKIERKAKEKNYILTVLFYFQLV
jgi:hypothetical protein